MRFVTNLEKKKHVAPNRFEGQFGPPGPPGPPTSAKPLSILKLMINQQERRIRPFNDARHVEKQIPTSKRSRWKIIAVRFEAGSGHLLFVTHCQIDLDFVDVGCPKIDEIKADVEIHNKPTK